MQASSVASTEAHKSPMPFRCFAVSPRYPSVPTSKAMQRHAARAHWHCQALGLDKTSDIRTSLCATCAWKKHITRHHSSLVIVTGPRTLEVYFPKPTRVPMQLTNTALTFTFAQVQRPAWISTGSHWNSDWLVYSVFWQGNKAKWMGFCQGDTRIQNPRLAKNSWSPTKNTTWDCPLMRLLGHDWSLETLKRFSSSKIEFDRGRIP